MPSLPPDNQVIGSTIDAYRRFFGYLRQHSPQRPRLILAKFTVYVCIICTLIIAPKQIFLYMYYHHYDAFLSYKLYFIIDFYQALLNFCFCLSISLVLYGYRTSNYRIIFPTVITINLFSFLFSSIWAYILFDVQFLQIETHTHTQTNEGNDKNYRSYISHNNWNIYSYYLLVVSFPLTLYITLFILHLSQFVCCCCCGGALSLQQQQYSLSTKKSRKSDTTHNHRAQNTAEITEHLQYYEMGGLGLEDNEVIEESESQSYLYPHKSSYHNHHDDTGLQISESTGDISLHSNRIVALSVSDINFQLVSSSSSAIAYQYMSVYCCVLLFVLSFWYFLCTISKNSSVYQNPFYILLLYLILCIDYHAGKYILKRRARKIDEAMVIANFSFEICTEIFMSCFYWCNLRTFIARFVFDNVLYFVVVFVIHMACEIFQDSIRSSAPYFKATPRLEYFKNQGKKSNLVQWKVRCAIDSSLRFVIAIYSIAYISLRYGLQSYEQMTTEEPVIKSMLFNYVVFAVECMYFAIVIFVPHCHGRIGGGQFLNMAEPLMRMYECKPRTFLVLFCGSIVIPSLLVV